MSWLSRSNVLRLGTVCVALVLAAAGGRVARATVDYTQDAKHAMLRVGEVVPDVEVLHRGVEVSLASSIKRSNATVLVILSTKCSTALGELSGWRDAALGSPNVRPVVVVAEADDNYVTYVEQLLGQIGFEIYTTGEDLLTMLGAEAVPVAYQIGHDRAVQRAGIGVQAVLELREAMLLDDGLRSAGDRR